MMEPAGLTNPTSSTPPHPNPNRKPRLSHQIYQNIRAKRFASPPLHCTPRKSTPARPLPPPPTSSQHHLPLQQQPHKQPSQRLPVQEQATQQPTSVLPSNATTATTATNATKRSFSRQLLSDRLKSVKKIRSLHRQKVLSVQKPQKKSPSIRKEQESRMIRTQARNRNKAIMLKVKGKESEKIKGNGDGQGELWGLQLASRLDRSFRDRTDVLERIELHLQVLNMLPSYAKHFEQIYEDTECWEELIFLTYKKFYLERRRVEAVLRSPEATNPFRLPFCAIGEEELREARGSLQAYHLESKMVEEDRAIGEALRNMYNHMIAKSGPFINLQEDIDFTDQICAMCAEQVTLLGQTGSQGVEGRMLQGVKVCLLVAALGGLPISLQTVLATTHYTSEAGKWILPFIR